MIETLSSVFPYFYNFTEIGRGGFSSVFSATHSKIQDLEIAIKVVNKYEIISADDRRNFEFEVEILKKLDFPFIITFYDLRENNEFFFISMELAKKGTLLEVINEKKKLDKDTSLRVFCQLSSTLFYLHNIINSIHRDIKVENIMFDNMMNLRLIDFGFSQIIKNKSKDSSKGKNKKIFTTLCGSYPYAAPEMLRLSPYSKPVDIWALGIVLYVCVVGKLPFDDPSIPKLAKMIVYNEPDYPEGIDEDIQQLLKRLLTKNPSERPTIEEVREYGLIKKSPYKIFFDVIGNENFMIRNISTQNEANADGTKKEEDIRDIYLDAEIIENLVQLGLDPTKVLSEGTEEMLLYRAQRKKKIEKIIGDDKLFKETLNSKNIPQKFLVQVTHKKQQKQKSQEQQQTQFQQPQPQRHPQQNQNRSQSQQIQQTPNQVELTQTQIQFKNHSHVDFIFSQQNQQAQSAQPAQPTQQRRGTPQQARQNQNQNQNTSNQDEDFFPNYQNYKQIKANQQVQIQQQQTQTQSQFQQGIQSQSQQQLQINQTLYPTACTTSSQHLQQSLQLQIQQQVQLQLQQKQPNQPLHPQSQPHPFSFSINSQKGNTGNTDITKNLVRINRKQHRSSSVASIIRQPPITITSQFVPTHQPISKCSTTGQSISQQPPSSTTSQQQQIMVIQKKRRAPSLGSHMPSFQNVMTAGPPSINSESDRGGHSKKIRSSISYMSEQNDPSTPTTGGRGHSQATSAGREVAPIMRPRKKGGKGHFISIISK